MPPPDVIRWTRLEPASRTADLQGGLRAEVHDPLWLLARQWQLGEFVGDDAGSPVQVALRLDSTPLTRYLPGGIPATWYPPTGSTGTANPAVAGLALDRRLPLEALVERETVRASAATRPRLAVEAGIHFLRTLSAAGADAARAGVLANFAFSAPTTPLDPDTQRFVDVVAGRAPDGVLLAAVVRAVAAGTPIASLTEPTRTAVQTWQTWRQSLAPDLGARVDTARTTWLTWYDTLFTEPDPTTGGPAWVPDQLEYAAAVAAPLRVGGEAVLAAPAYFEGHLDWYSFDVQPAGSLGAVRDDLSLADKDREVIQRTVFPTGVHFPGMPASRYWEFEDAAIDFGAVAAGAQQLAYLLLVEFGLVSGDDWFIVPVDLPVGTITRTRWLVVTDTFGLRTLVPSAREADTPIDGTPLPWDMFRLSPDPRPVAGVQRLIPDALFLPPVLGNSLASAPLEEVVLLRDEMANMAWAVERVVENALNQPLDRATAFHRARDQAPPPTATGPLSAYRLATDVPDYWLPLYADRAAPELPPIRLRVGGLPAGRMLLPIAPATQLNIQGVEVPREGARLTRAYQYARWIDGRTYLWMGRQKGAGIGESSSGLRFDTLQPPAGTPGG
jgi:hypothetical protein